MIVKTLQPHYPPHSSSDAASVVLEFAQLVSAFCEWII
jgi:hypothetical protein